MVQHRRNVGKGTPPWWDIIPNSVTSARSTPQVPRKSSMPGAGYEGVTKFVMDVMTSYGINACPATGGRGRCHRR